MGLFLVTYTSRDDLPWEDEKAPYRQIRPTLERFQGQHWVNSWETGWSAYMGIPERIDTILNWTELNWTELNWTELHFHTKNDLPFLVCQTWPWLSEWVAVPGMQRLYLGDGRHFWHRHFLRWTHSSWWHHPDWHENSFAEFFQLTSQFVNQSSEQSINQVSDASSISVSHGVYTKTDS